MSTKAGSLRALADHLSGLDRESGEARMMRGAADEIEDGHHIQAAVIYVVERFERDEAQGYRSRARQFAIEILRNALNRWASNRQSAVHGGKSGSGHPAILREQASSPRAVQDLTAHKIMTPEEYAASNLQGWHAVCKNHDGCGGVAVRYSEADMCVILSEENDALIEENKRLRECLESIRDAKFPKDHPAVDDADWRFTALECKRAASSALTP